MGKSKEGASPRAVRKDPVFKRGYKGNADQRWRCVGRGVRKGGGNVSSC